VIDFLVARYGEFVLLKPRLNSHTWLLWFLPALVLAGGGAALWMHNRRRVQSGPAQGGLPLELTADEEARLNRLMAAESASER
jgi:cytochrome c-type biogenesis protein CcmH